MGGAAPCVYRSGAKVHECPQSHGTSPKTPTMVHHHFRLCSARRSGYRLPLFRSAPCVLIVSVLSSPLGWRLHSAALSHLHHSTTQRCGRRPPLACSALLGCPSPPRWGHHGRWHALIPARLGSLLCTALRPARPPLRSFRQPACLLQYT